MKAIRILRAILRLLYFFSILNGLFLPITFIIASNADVIFQISGYLLSNHHWSFYLVMILFFVGYLFFVMMLYHLKNAAFKITPKQLFNDQIANSLKKAGWFCIIGVVLMNVPAWIYHLFSLMQNIDLGNSAVRIESGFGATLVIVSFGLFLVILSKLASEGVKLKQENDLTI
ncbi:DUF2975 domain-containing protein [Nonlabens sp. SCSIO 43208]|uniref:DUF2975 domain-containing protein n=1 Tax=Nonlabens sp. SCSIO 43208 TaxID=2793009 RepID=UPI003D6A5355